MSTTGLRPKCSLLRGGAPRGSRFLAVGGRAGDAGGERWSAHAQLLVSALVHARTVVVEAHLATLQGQNPQRVSPQHYTPKQVL